MIDGIIQWFEKLPGIADMLLHNGLDQTLIIFSPHTGLRPDTGACTGAWENDQI